MLHRPISLAATVVCVVCVAAATLGDATEPLIGDRQARIFQQACAHCHVRPGIGVPVLGDVPEWVGRREKGFEALVSNTVEGVGGMPPLGTCSFCTEDDVRRLVAFIAGYPALPEPGEGAP